MSENSAWHEARHASLIKSNDMIIELRTLWYGILMDYRKAYQVNSDKGVSELVAVDTTSSSNEYVLSMRSEATIAHIAAATFRPHPLAGPIS